MIATALIAALTGALLLAASQWGIARHRRAQLAAADRQVADLDAKHTNLRAQLDSVRDQFGAHTRLVDRANQDRRAAQQQLAFARAQRDANAYLAAHYAGLLGQAHRKLREVAELYADQPIPLTVETDPVWASLVDRLTDGNEA